MIYVVRHGQTEGNVAGTLRGSAFDDELNQAGIAEAKLAGQELAGVKFDVCYCSPLKRTRQTCEYLLESRKGKVPINYEQRIVPRNYGNNIGRTPQEMIAEGYWDRNLNLKVVGGESVLEFEKRVFGLLDEIKAKHAGQNVLIVTHGSVCPIITSYYNGAPAEGKHVALGSRALANCGVLKFKN